MGMYLDVDCFILLHIFLDFDHTFDSIEHSQYDCFNSDVRIDLFLNYSSQMNSFDFTTKKINELLLN